jgi:hypothetical protein
MQVEVGGLKPKEAIRLSFKLPVSGVVIDAAGVVVWGKGNRQGIQFTSVGSKSQQSIRRFMAEIENMEG